MKTSRDGTPSVPGVEAKLSTFICLCFDSHYLPNDPPPADWFHWLRPAAHAKEDLEIKVWFTGKANGHADASSKKKQQPKS